MALITDMGVVGAGNEILQPQYKNRWKVEFIGIGMGATGAGPNENTLTLMATNADRPKLSFEEIVLDRYNSRAYLAGKHSFEMMNVTFEPDSGGRVQRILQAQLESQQKLIGMSAAPRMPAAPRGQDYKFGIILTQLDGDAVELERWLIEGAWIQNIDQGDLDYAASETVKITVSFRFDHARQDIRGFEGRATGNPLLT